MKLLFTQRLRSRCVLAATIALLTVGSEEPGLAQGQPAGQTPVPVASSYITDPVQQIVDRSRQAFMGKAASRVNYAAVLRILRLLS